MTRTRTRADVRASFVSWVRRERTEFVMVVWGGIVGLLLLSTAALMLVGNSQPWLLVTLVVSLALWLPPRIYFQLRHRSNHGIKRRPYRSVLVDRHEQSDGSLTAVSWRWSVMLGSVLAAVASGGVVSSVFFASPTESFWAVGMLVLGGLAAALVFSAVVTHPLADRAARRLQAELEREHPDSTFVIFKSAQVSSQIACADPASVLTHWSDVTFRAVVTVDGDGLRVWDQFWGKRKNVATLPWSRVESLEPAIATVRWRYVRAVNLSLICAPGEPNVGVVLPPARYHWGFHPLPDTEFAELHRRLGTSLATSWRDRARGSAPL